MSNRLWFGTNWKMNLDPTSAMEWGNEIRRYIERAPNRFEFFFMPPYLLLSSMIELFHGTRVMIGGQNCHWQTSGAHTGEISARLLKQTNSTIVLAGHAERRAQFCETEEMIHKKVQAILHEGLKVVLCIGENAESKDDDVKRQSVLETQLSMALEDIDPSQMCDIVVAYEPVWAIGHGGVQPSVENVATPLRIIREWIDDRHAEATPVIYGGSVTPYNCAELISIPYIDGLFVGRHALNAKAFITIMETTLSTRSQEN